MKGDSGATSHYVRPDDRKWIKDVKHFRGPSILLPDADTISPSHQGVLTLHRNLSGKACVGTILPNLKSSSLMSLGQLCDNGCDILINKQNLYALKNKEVILIRPVFSKVIVIVVVAWFYVCVSLIFVFF